MKLHWQRGTGPKDTKGLAEDIRKEGKLYRYIFVEDSRRCLWGVIEDWYIPTSSKVSCSRRSLSPDSDNVLINAGVRPRANDAYGGTATQRAEHFARILEAL